MNCAACGDNATDKPEEPLLWVYFGLSANLIEVGICRHCAKLLEMDKLNGDSADEPIREAFEHLISWYVSCHSG